MVKRQKLYIEKFIEAIESHPQLYDRKSNSYMNNYEKEKIWENLSNMFNCNAKKKWTSIRDRYVRERRKLRNATETGTEYSKWTYFDALKFLDDLKPRIKTENSSANIIIENVVVETDENNSYYDEGTDRLSYDNSSYHLENEMYTLPSGDSISQNGFEPKKKVKKRELEVDNMHKVKRHCVETLQTETKARPDIKERTFAQAFADVVAIQMAKVPEEMQLNVSIEIMKVLNEAIKNK